MIRSENARWRTRLLRVALADSSARRSRNASMARCGLVACCAWARELRTEVGQRRLRHAGGLVDVDDLAGLGDVGDRVRQQPLDLLGDRLAAGLALLGVELRHPDPDLFVEPRPRCAGRARSRLPAASAHARASWLASGGTGRRARSSPSATWLPGVAGERR